MSVNTHLLLPFFITLCTMHGLHTADTLLSKSAEVVVENSTLTLTCSKKDGTMNETRWTYSKIQGTEAVCARIDNKCMKSLFLKNNSEYNCTCNDNGSFSVNIKHVDRSQHGVTWSCRELGHEESKGSTVKINVSVPVAKVLLQHPDNGTVRENYSTTFQCNTTYSLPAPIIRWYRSNEPSVTAEQEISLDRSVNITRKTYNSTDNLILVVETLTCRLNRLVHGWDVFCIASNWKNEQVTSNRIVLNVIYPPSQPPMIHNFKNESSYKVMENTAASLSCSVEGGNPPAKPRWVCNNLINSSLVEHEDTIKVTSNMSWIAMRTQEETCSCETDHVLSKAFTFVNVEVLYPPTFITLQAQYGNITKNVTADVKLMESKNYSLKCYADGKPPPSKFTWRGTKNFTISNNASLDLSNVKRDGNGTYSCVAQNIMVPTNGENETGSRSMNVQVDILYKPTVSKLMNRDVEEGLSLNITCKVRSSNPNITDVVWTRDKNDIKIHSNPLILRNISRHDSMNYTCTMKNTMIPAVGDKEEGQGSGSFHLNVLYKASVQKFLVTGHKEKPVVANESTSIQFHCEIDSNPDSDTTIILPNGTKLWSTSSNNLIYSHLLSSCLDKGNYTCSGGNKYNDGSPVNASLSLLINCKPMAKYPVKEDIRSELYVPVTLQFTALAYPEPEFTWEIWTNSSWSKLENDSMFYISSSDLNINLTIRNFTSTQAMLFRLVAENFMGNVTHNFTLQPFDRPEKPFDFAYVETYLTETSVMLSWRAGFNGGLPQNFFIKYRRVTDQEWNTLVFPDTGQDLINFTIRGLDRSTVYVFRIYAENMKNMSDILEINVTTKATEIIPRGNSLVVLVVGSISGVLVISGGMVFGIILYRKRYTFKKNTETGRLLYQNVPFTSIEQSKNRKIPTKKEISLHPLQDLDDTPPEYNEPTEYYNSPENIEQMEKIRVSELLQYVSDRTEEAFAAEYQKLPTGLQNPCTFARKPENIAMNRYNGIYPYDHSRVKIPGQPDFFINACYIHGYARQNAYIASLGPTKKVTDNYKTFWMMVWSEESDIIVMLTNLQEPSGMKCEQYWPDYGTSIMCSDIQVTCDREDVYAEYTARLLTVSYAHEQRSVTHLHYTAWPDKKVPEDVTTLIEFRERIKATPSSKKGPMIVHCSAGIGRTGTLIALDRLIEEGQCESAVDVFKCVDDMREQRVKMVQTQEQYIYIYKALVNRLYFDCETIPVESFQEYVSTTNDNIYSRQFRQLKESVETCSKDERDARAANQLLVHKNRRGADIPGDQNRIRMYLQMDESDYINAVYVHSLKKKDHFISAQSPLPDTVSDFLCMLYQENCCCVVTMEDLQEPGLAVGRYLPSGGRTLKTGRFEVSCTTLETKAQYSVTEMRIKRNGQPESGEKALYHFQYNNWVPGSDVPSEPKAFIQFIQDVEDYSDQLGEENSHVLVHCLKANERSGLYCIVAILMEKIRYERQVSVLNTVRHFRTRRRTAFTSMEQLKFCYKAVSAYINMYES